MHGEYLGGERRCLRIFDGVRRVAIRLKKYLRSARARFEKSGNLRDAMAPTNRAFYNATRVRRGMRR